MNQQGIETHEWKWAHVKEAFLDPKSFFWFALMFSISLVSHLSTLEDNYLHNVAFQAVVSQPLAR